MTLQKRQCIMDFPMRRILLVLEDYNEQVFLETLLKKIGFDALSVRNELLLSDQMLIFKPDVIIGTGDGVKLKGINIQRKMQKNRVPAKLILLFPLQKLQDQKLMASYSADVAVETPVNPRVLIETICIVAQLDASSVIKKFEKLPIAKNEEVKSDGIKVVSGKLDDKKYSRKDQYSQILKKSQSYPDLGFAKPSVAEELTKIRQYEKEETEEVKKIDEERKKFVVALYKK